MERFRTIISVRAVRNSENLRGNPRTLGERPIMMYDFRGMGVKKLSKIVGYHLWMFPRLFESEGFASKHSFSNLGGGGNYPRVPTALRCL